MPATLELLPPRAVPGTSVPVIRLALAGCGVVGSELVRLLSREADNIQQQHGVRFELTSVLIRDRDRTRNVSTARELFTDDVDEFLRAPADIVVEAIGGLDPALRIAQSAVDRGARFITANKALIAEHGARLHSSARLQGAEIQFEAAVGGSVPVIRVLRAALGTSRPQAIRGILNGTSNFILTRLEEGRSFSEAVAEAQQRGLAEADPGRDLDGRDAQDKISILSWLAYGVTPESVQATRNGLLPHIQRVVLDAHAVDAKARLIAECVLRDGALIVNVEPVIVAADSAFGRTTHENNLIRIELGWGAPVELGGPGAGGAPTASALLGDLLQVTAPRALPLDAPPCVTDQREHRWSISITSNERAALGTLERAGVVARLRQLRLGGVCLHTAPIARTPLQKLLAQLDRLHANPVATRLDAELAV